jgi:plasmid segregation protein ParM
MRGQTEEFEFHGKKFEIYINQATAYPQAFAAAMPAYNQISAFPKTMVVDIGGFTADYLLLKKGQADLTVCGTLEHGVIALYNQISEKINSELDILLEESDIDAIIKGEPVEYSDEVLRLIFDAAQEFTNDLFGKLRERSIDLRSGKTMFVGGGAILLRKQIEASGKVSAPVFMDKISANAKGYELLYRAQSISR